MLRIVWVAGVIQTFADIKKEDKKNSGWTLGYPNPLDINLIEYSSVVRSNETGSLSVMYRDTGVTLLYLLLLLGTTF
jgi:hypothetical protein